MMAVDLEGVLGPQVLLYALTLLVPTMNGFDPGSVGE